MNKKRLILIVDDDKDLSTALKRTLAKEGYQIEQAFGVKECKQVLTTLTPDLILMDVIMPDGNGIDFANELNQHEKFNTIGILLMSGLKTDAIDKIKGIEVGALDYVNKPVQMKNLVQRINLIFSAQNLEKKRSIIQANYDQLFSNINDLAFVLDSDGKLKKISNSFKNITGYSIASWENKNFHQIITKEDMAKWKYHFRLAIKNEIQQPFELKIKNAGGGIVVISVVLSSLKIEDEQDINIMGIAKDLSASKLFEVSYYDKANIEKETQNRELKRWDDLSKSSTTVTQGTYEVSAFDSGFTNIFVSLLEDYNQLIEKSIETRIYKVEQDYSIVRKEYANRLGFLKVGPRDLVKIHSEFFKNLDKNVHPKRLALYHEEARLALLEIMGYLVAYYRNRSLK